jgi:aminoglycoside 6'-N-acetyltransferase I
MEIRPIRPDEHEAWLELRVLLWPDHARERLREDQTRLLRDPDRNVVLFAAEPGAKPVGFIEASIRDWAEGCQTEPIGYIEGWFVLAEHRRRGIGRLLVEAAEAWALSKGCSEMGSDAEIWNDVSHRAHQALGYSEATRLVCFSKRLSKARPGG